MVRPAREEPCNTFGQTRGAVPTQNMNNARYGGATHGVAFNSICCISAPLSSDRFERTLENALYAQQLGVMDVRGPSVGLFAKDLFVSYAGFLVGTPQHVTFGSFSTDIDLDVHASISLSNDKKAEKALLLASGMSGSAWEATIWSLSTNPKKPDADRGISTYHMLRYAAQTGVPIDTIRRSNLQSVLPKLTLPASTLESIKNAVAANKVVVTPARQMTKDGWKGVGYIIHDELTGAAAYRISGGKSGGLWLAAGGIASYRVRSGPTKAPPSVFKPPSGGIGLLELISSILLFSVGVAILYSTWKKTNDTKSSIAFWIGVVLTIIITALALKTWGLLAGAFAFLAMSSAIWSFITKVLTAQATGTKLRKNYMKKFKDFL